MLPLPSKIEFFRARHNAYYVGLDCVYHQQADELSMAKLVITKLGQIISYCAKYRRSVTVICNSATIPESIAGLLLTLGVKIQSVVKQPEHTRLYGDFYISEAPRSFLAKNTEVILALRGKDDDYDIEDNEKNTPVCDLIYRMAEEKNSRTDNPADVIKEFKKKARPNNDPYGVFDLGQQGTRVYDNYYKRIMIAPESTGKPGPLRISGK